jgi:hypothetical protein
MQRVIKSGAIIKRGFHEKLNPYRLANLTEDQLQAMIIFRILLKMIVSQLRQ